MVRANRWLTADSTDVADLARRVADHALPLRESADLVHRVTATARVVGEVGQLVGPGGVDEAEAPGDPQPGLVGADDP